MKRKEPDIDPDSMIGQAVAAMVGAVIGLRHGIGHKELFIAKLANAMFCGGSLIVTQILPVKIKMNGSKIPIPLKNKYGFYLGNDGWYALSKEEVKDAFSKDHKTGKPITPEEDVLYQEIEICK